MTRQVLVPLDEILVPPVAPERRYATRVFGREFSFMGLKRLLGAADVSKAGDRGAGLCAQSELEREAAREILSGLTLEELHAHPLTNSNGRVDDVMRVNYDLDPGRFGEIASWTLGELKNFLLAGSSQQVETIGGGLTGVMASGLAKLMDTHELILAARKIRRPTKARTWLGLPGTLSSRLQPNHPADDLRGITLLIQVGLSLGAGDALWGVNPALDSVRNVSGLLWHLDKLRRATGAPTQICVLGHVKTQLECLRRGAPVEILFQSLAGTEATNLTEFDISVDLLDQAYQTMSRQGALAGEAEQFMYFETGQGSEYSYGKHQGIDMCTTEALCYGLARRWDPFMVNNVTGFIGPETHLDNMEMIQANLQDHFMGKLLGCPMGMAPCYTLHSHITLEGQQVATQLLAAAGANYYMDVYLNTDRMLAYFDTSGHDDQTLRELHGRLPAPEFLAWALERGIFQHAANGTYVANATIERGPRWGDPRIFATELELAELARATPSTPGFANAGPRPAESITRRLRANQALSREAIQRELDVEVLSRVMPLRILETRAAHKADHLSYPAHGARLSAASAAQLASENTDVQVVISDGLSAEAVHAQVPELLPVLMDGLASRGLKLGQPIVVRHGRVKLAEQIAECLQTRLVIMLIGERPGGDASSSRSLSAYLAYQLLEEEEQASAAEFSDHLQMCFEYSVLSNIHADGLPPIEAGSVIAELAWRILDHHAAGNRLEALLRAKADPPPEE